MRVALPPVEGLPGILIADHLGMDALNSHTGTPFSALTVTVRAARRLGCVPRNRPRPEPPDQRRVNVLVPLSQASRRTGLRAMLRTDVPDPGGPPLLGAHACGERIIRPV